MIDMRAYLAHCAAPYSHDTHNCFTATLAAFPTSPRVALLVEWWRALASGERIEAATVWDLRSAALEFADVHGFRPADPLAPTGNEIGLAACAGRLLPTLCVGAKSSWFARGRRGAYRIPSRFVLDAWSVE